jgi:hypothetical protein
MFSVSSQTAGRYCDNLGRCFVSFKNPAGVIYGIAIPEVATAPFDTILQITAPIKVAWAGLAWTNSMTSVPLVITWTDGNKIMSSARVA